MTAAAGPPDEAGRPSRSRPGCVTIRCRRDGPLVVEAPSDGGPGFRVIDHEGTEFSLPAGKPAVALCRCGRSGTRPFCDGSHRGAGFQADDLAGP